MKKYTVYHNSRCSKSRNALQLLDEMKAEYEIVEYLKEPL
ncbi:MAG: arsenate reductase, partial [Crocinitomicaceae bacterium]